MTLGTDTICSQFTAGRHHLDNRLRCYLYPTKLLTNYPTDDMKFIKSPLDLWKIDRSFSSSSLDKYYIFSDPYFSDKGEIHPLSYSTVPSAPLTSYLNTLIAISRVKTVHGHFFRTP